jgi:hypothetical protein
VHACAPRRNPSIGANAAARRLQRSDAIISALIRIYQYPYPHLSVPLQVIAGQYQVIEYLGSAAFSKAVQCIDLRDGSHVCIKIIK